MKTKKELVIEFNKRSQPFKYTYFAYDCSVVLDGDYEISDLERILEQLKQIEQAPEN